MTLDHDVALVTGAARGIGKALVQELISRGIKKVYAAGRSDSVVKAFEGNAKVVPLIADVSDAHAVAAAAAKASGVTLVFSNAGVLDFGSILTVSDDTLRRNFDTNFYGLLNVARSFAPVLEKNGGGHFTTILSVVSLASMPGLAAYNASKAAALSATQSLRADLSKKGVQVHAVFPGPVDTDMAEALTIEKAPPQVVAKAIVDGVINGEEDIWPDPMAQQIYSSWKSDPKAIEKQFATM